MIVAETTPELAREGRLLRQRQLAKAKHERQRKNPLAYAPGITLLAAIGRYHYLTLAQAMRLTGWRADTYTVTWLKHLASAGYLYDKNIIVDSLGRPKAVWSLTRKGKHALHERGYRAEIHVPHNLKKDSDWLKHVRDLNDALMQFERLAKAGPDWRLTGFRHDLELQCRAPTLTLPDGTKRMFVPDGWVAIEHEEDEFCFCLEMDRGTEREGGKPWKEKIRAYVAFAKEPYRQLFGRERISVLVVVRSHHQTDQRRLENLVRWTEEELTELKRQSWGGLFLFTIQHADETDPRIFFGSPSWSRPFDHTPIALLEGAPGHPACRDRL